MTHYCGNDHRWRNIVCRFCFNDNRFDLGAVHWAESPTNDFIWGKLVFSFLFWDFTVWFPWRFENEEQKRRHEQRVEVAKRARD